MNNWINDPMHTVAEGIIPWVLGCVLFSLSRENDWTIEFINFRIQRFFSTSKVIRPHQPKPFSAIQTPGKGLKPNLTAAENLALFQHFPLIFSQFVDLKSKPWRLLLQLQEIIDIILAPKITEGMLAHFATQYAEFLENFSALYPDVSIRPKMHFLVQYGPKKSERRFYFESHLATLRPPHYRHITFGPNCGMLGTKRKVGIREKK